jgi:hypothetical protein
LDYQLFPESSSHLLLVSQIQLSAGTGNVEYVGRRLTLSVDDRDLDIATQFCHG